MFSWGCLVCCLHYFDVSWVSGQYVSHLLLLWLCIKMQWVGIYLSGIRFCKESNWKFICTHFTCFPEKEVKLFFKWQMQVNSLIFLGFLFIFYLLIIIVYFIIIAYCSLVIRIALCTHIVQDVLVIESSETQVWILVSCTPSTWEVGCGQGVSPTQHFQVWTKKSFPSSILADGLQNRRVQVSLEMTPTLPEQCLEASPPPNKYFLKFSFLLEFLLLSSQTISLTGKLKATLPSNKTKNIKAK